LPGGAVRFAYPGYTARFGLAASRHRHHDWWPMHPRAGLRKVAISNRRTRR